MLGVQHVKPLHVHQITPTGTMGIEDGDTARHIQSDIR